MNFLNPAVLIALVAAGIPVLLHILNLRKLKTIEFSTIRFIEELKKTQIKRLKLKQLILLILRILIIVSIVFAFSRPVIQGSFPLFQNYAKSSSVIVIDNSVSMDLSDENGSRFTQAKNIASKIINQLSEGSEISIVPLSDASINNSTDFSKNYEKLLTTINDMKLNLVPANMDIALTVAESFLDDANNINKEIFIISDFQNNTFQNNLEDTLRFENSDATIFLIPIGMLSNSDIKNLSVDSLKILSSIFQTNKPIEIEASIHNHSQVDNDGIVVSLLFNNHRISQRNIDIPAQQSRTISISGVPQNKGVIDAKLEIEGDALETDNERYFGVIIPETNNTLVIGNNKMKGYFKAFFEDVSIVQDLTNHTTIQANEITSTDLSLYDVVILNEAIYAENQLSRIQQFVNNGGSALVFANDSTNAAIFSTFIDSLGFGKLANKQYSSNAPITFTEIDKLHPIFESVFEGTTDSKHKTIETPILKKAQLVSGAYPIIKIGNNGFLTQSKHGSGNAIFIGSSLTEEWGNFAITGLFPTLLHRSLLQLSSSNTASINIILGEEKTIPIPDVFRNKQTCRALDPHSKEAYFNIINTPMSPVILAGQKKKIGNYTIFNEKNEASLIFSQNLNPSESDIAPMAKTDLEKEIKVRYSKNTVNFVEDTHNIDDNIIRARIGTELWKIFALLALCFAVTEMIIARVGTKSNQD